MLCVTDDFNGIKRCQTPEDFRIFTGTLAKLKADRIALDAASPDLTNYPTAVGTVYASLTKAPFYEADPDPLATVVPQLQGHGCEVLANVRMNDHHGRVEQWAAWEREHVEWSLGVDTGARDWKSIGKLRCMDYAVREVREHRLAIIEEILSRYPFEGIQLDFSRTPPFVSQPKMKHGQYMTEYIREVAQRVKEGPSGTARILGVIVPWDLELCAMEGLEVEQWIQEGLLDYVSPGEKYYADWNIDLNPWLDLTEGTTCDLIPVTPGNVSPYQDFENGEISLLGEHTVVDLPKLRAIADNLYGQGAEHFGLYNFYTFDYGDIYEEVREAVTAGAGPGKPRHFFYCRRLSYVYREYLAFDKGVAFDRYPLMDPGETAEWTFRFHPDGGVEPVQIRFAVKHLMPKDQLRVLLNGTELEGLSRTYEAVERFGRKAIHSGFLGRTLSPSAFEKGLNILRVEVLGRSEFREPLEVGEVEIRTGDREAPNLSPEPAHYPRVHK